MDDVMDLASGAWDGREPWIDAVSRAAGAGMAVWCDSAGVIDVSGWDGVEDTDPAMVSPLASEVES